MAMLDCLCYKNRSNDMWPLHRKIAHASCDCLRPGIRQDLENFEEARVFENFLGKHLAILQ